MGYNTCTPDSQRYERLSERRKRRRLDTDSSIQVESAQETPLNQQNAATQATVEKADVACQTEGLNTKEELELLQKCDDLKTRCELLEGAMLTKDFLQNNEQTLSQVC